MSQVAEPRFPLPSWWGRGAAINRRTRPLLGELHSETQRLSLGLCEGPRMRREMKWDRCWGRRPQGLSNHPPPLPPPSSAPGRAAWRLTQVVGAAQVEGVAAVHVVVQGLLNQVLRLVPRQLRHSAESNPGGMSAGCWAVPTLDSCLSAGCPPSLRRALSVASSAKWAHNVDEELSVTEWGPPSL